MVGISASIFGSACCLVSSLLVTVGFQGTPHTIVPSSSATVRANLQIPGSENQEERLQESLASADRALAAALAGKDLSGEAEARRARARLLQELGRIDVCIREWKEAAGASERAGGDPETVVALVAAAVLMPAEERTEAEQLLRRALEIGETETNRPLEVAQALHDAGWSCFHRGLLIQARDFFSRAIAIRERLAPDSLELASSLNGLGYVIGYTLPPGSSGFREEFGIDKPNISGPLGDLLTAAGLHRRALSIQEKFSRQSEDVGQTLTFLGILAVRQGDVFRGRISRESESYLTRAMGIREFSDSETLELALSLQGLSYVALWKGEFNEAHGYITQANGIRQKLAPISVDMAETYFTLGDIAQWQGDLLTAEGFVLRALEIEEKLMPGSLQVAWVLKRLGYLTHYRGDLAAARRYNEQALSIRMALVPNSLYAADSLHATGNVLFELGDYVAAREYLQEALQIYEDQAPHSMGITYALHGLGRLARALGDLMKAREYHQRALLLREVLAPETFVLTASLNQLGMVAQEQGDLDTAERHYLRALGIIESQFPNPMFISGTLYGLGLVAFARGDLLKAEGLFRRALYTVQSVAPDSLTAAEILLKLAGVSSRRGDMTEAERLARQAWNLSRHQAKGIYGDEARQAFGVKTGDYAAVLLRAQLALGKPLLAFITLEEGRAQALQQILADRQLESGGGDSQSQQRYRAAVTARNQAEWLAAQASTRVSLAERKLDRLLEQGLNGQEVQKAIDALGACESDLREAQTDYTLARVKSEQIWAEVAKAAPGAHAPPMTVQLALQALSPGTLFIAFSTDQDQSWVFLLRTASFTDQPTTSIEDRILTYHVPMTQKDLIAWVNRLRKEISSRQRLSRGGIVGRSLFAKLFPSEAARRALSEAHRLLISPDGALWDLPFAALVTNTAGVPRYLGETKPITYVQSLSLYAQSRTDTRTGRPGRRVHALVVGDPVFDRASPGIVVQDQGPETPGGDVQVERANRRRLPTERDYLSFNGQPVLSLPETRREANEVGRIYNIDPLTGESATEAAVRSRIGSADVIHLATHGYFNPLRPMSSGILLTLPRPGLDSDDTSSDGALLAWEIYSQLKLQAELVVLSACESGRGYYVRNEGIVGLTRALQYAGARSVVASQWNVPDKSTSDLMVAFHRFLRRGLDKDEALQQAMAVVRRKRATALPYYWAGFILMGDPDNPILGTSTVQSGL